LVVDFVLDRPDFFPAGTEVGLYLAGSFPNRFSGPSAGALQTATVGEDEEGEATGETAITFTELEVRRYIAAAEVDGQWRTIRFIPGKLGSSLQPPERYPEHSPG
jgi:hypothetical protein